MNPLYICSTLYHVLITCLKAMSGIKADIVVTEYIPQPQELAKRLEKSGLFGRVMYIPSPKEYVPSCKLSKLLCLHRRNAMVIREQLTDDIAAWDDIYLFHDDTWMAHYLKDIGHAYHLVEDALNSYEVIWKSKFAYMMGKSVKSRIKLALGYGYRYLDKSAQVIDIEVNRAEHIKLGRLKIVPRERLYSVLNTERTEMLADIFRLDKRLAGRVHDGTLILTEPLSEDGLTTDEQQEAFYGRLASEFSGALYIKRHPRDRCEYSGLDCVFLQKDIPFEVAVVAGGMHFDRVLISQDSTMMSFAEACPFADDIQTYQYQEIK